MANQVTRIADVIVPEVFSSYVIERTAELSAIFSSGIAIANPKLNQLITGGGRTITLPAFKDLTGRSQLLSDTTPLETKKIGTKADVAVALYRGNAWSSNDLASALAGSDPQQAIADLVADYWAREQNAILVDVLTGAFAATSMAALKIGDTSTYYDGDLIVDAQGKLGDAAGKLQGLIMHSQVRNDLLKKDKTAFRMWREEGVEYNKYLNYDVIVDDSCPYDSTNGTYTSYLFARGAVSLGMGQPVGMPLTETDRDILAGDDVLANRLPMVIHPNGMKWKGTPATETPSDTELRTGTNWERVSDIKNMGIVQVTAKIGSAPAQPVTPPTGG